MLTNIAYSRDGTANMIKVLAKQRGGIRICHINAQSLRNKMDEFNLIFQDSGMDFICVSETWFDKYVTDLSISLDGYNVCRVDRNSFAGGIAIYVKKGIRFNLIAKSGNNDDQYDYNLNLGPNLVEYLFIEVASEGRKLLIGSVYRPNKNIPIDCLMTTLELISSSYEEIIIAGDFNCNSLVDSYLTDSMLTIGLFSPNTCFPTHFTATSCTLLDLFFVDNKSKILLYDQLSAPCFSKHDLIFLSYKFELHIPDQLLSYRDFKNIDFVSLQNEFLKIDWHNIYYLVSSDDQLRFLEENINMLYDTFVPLKIKTISYKKKPWFSGSIKDAIARRDFAYNRWKRFKTDQLHEEYRSERNEANKLIKKAKSEFYAAKFSTAIGSRKKWNIIREIGIGKANNQKACNIDPDALNEKFLNLPILDSDLNYYHNFDNSENSRFSFSGVTQNDVLVSCLSIKSNAVGSDGIHPKFLKLLLPQLLPYITLIFNKILTTSNYPSQWKIAKIIPIPKTNNDFRPIAILPFLSKVFERLVHIQICTFLDNNKLLNNCQSGFRKNNSCVTALVDVAEEVRMAVDDKNICFLILLDHSKAFDMVAHHILCYKLHNMFKFSSNATKLISSYLTNRCQFVQTTYGKSNLLPVKTGVPQGSIIGPLLFSLYSNDLPTIFNVCKVRMYADDVQLYTSCHVNDTEQCVETLNQELNRVYLWATANGLEINPNKSKCIIIQKRLSKSLITPIFKINNQPIEIVNSAKNLGIIFNNSLTWSDHINYACGRTFSMLRTLWQSQYCTPINLRILLAKTYLIPILLYGCELFGNCDRNSKDKLNMVFKNIIRYVFGLKRYSHTSAFVNRLYGIGLDDFIKCRVLMFLHKIIYNNKPEHLYQRFIFARSNRGRRLILFRHQSLVSEWQFFIFAPRLWNIIPHSLQCISNAQQFKKYIFEFFYNSSIV